MKIAQPVIHDDKTYAYGDDVSAEDAKNLPEGYAVSDSEFKKMEEEATNREDITSKPASELTEEELANHPSQAPTVPPAEPNDDEDDDDKAVPTQPKAAGQK